MSLKTSWRNVRRRKAYEWSQIGVTRARTLNNDGSIVALYRTYFGFCGYQNSFALADIFSKLTPKEIAKVVSEINTYAKKDLSGQFNPKDWVKIVDLGNMLGYPKAKDRIFKDDLVKWLVEPGLPCKATVDEIIREFRLIMGTQVGSGLNKFGSYERWLFARWTWMNTGAAHASKLEYHGERVNTKFGAALSLTDKELLQATSLKEIYSEGIRAFIKPDEKGVKGRFIANASLGVYTRQKYLFEALMASHPEIDKNMTMFMSGGDKIKTTRATLESSFHIPIDFEAFDYNVSREFWIAFFVYCSEELSGDAASCASEVSDMLGLLEVRDVEGKVVGKWNKGMPSGFYLTSFCDSLFNLAAQRIIQRRSAGKYEAGKAQGDDGDMISHSVPVLSELADLFLYVGMKVNKQKNWWQFGVTEYLKQVITLEAVYQYPARAFASLVWAYPDFRNIGPQEKLQALAVLWKEFFDRMGYVDEQLMVKDIQIGVFNRFRWTKKRVTTWLHTPTQFGGFGLLPLDFTHKFSFKLKTEDIRYKNNQYKRYPVFKQTFEKAIVGTITMFDRINTLQIRAPNMFDIFTKSDINFHEYIEYTRWAAGLSSSITLPFRRIKTSSEIPFRLVGWSDIYVLDNFPLKNFLGITRDFITTIRSLQRSALYGENFHVQLWK